MTNEEMVQKITECEQRGKSNSHRINRLEEQNEALHKIATSVEVIATVQKNQSEDISGIREDVDVLKSAPGNKWERVTEYVALAVIGAALGLLLSQIGL